MSPILRVVMAALKLAGNLLPESLRDVVTFITGLVSGLNLPPADPRNEKIAALIAGVLEDLDSALQLDDADAMYAARLTIENRFLREWVKISPGRGI